MELYFFGGPYVTDTQLSLDAYHRIGPTIGGTLAGLGSIGFCQSPLTLACDAAAEAERFDEAGVYASMYVSFGT